ncbi:MAG: hypothetical protein M3540_10985 [Actinomycetota bacterium]|nr:hypothetical protein [Actinomycetota bacterium]
MRVNKLKDFIDRVGWTAIQAAAAAGITALSSPDLTLATGLKFVGTAALLAVLKVLAAQNVGDSGDGAAIPGGVEK